MYQIERMLVGLDLSFMDKDVILYSWMIAKPAEVKEMIFTHILKDWQHTLQVIDKQADTQEETLRLVEAYLDEKIQASLPSDLSYLSIKVMVLAGDPLTKMLELEKENDTDLIVVGRKSITPHQELLSRKLIRKARCSVFIVSENPRFSFKKIFIPITFNENSRYALQRACSFAKDYEAEIESINTFKLPTGYHTSGKTKTEFAETLKKHARRRFDGFIRQIDTQEIDISAKFVLAETGIPQVIYKHALVAHADLMIIGSRGRRTGAMARLLSSVAEQLSLIDVNIPLLVIKDKNKPLTWFGALRDM